MRQAIIPALTLVALSLFTGCGSNVHDGVNMKNKVGFGTVVPNTGPQRQMGAELYRGMSVAEHTLNATGGVDGKAVKVVVYDSAGEPEKGLDGVRRLTRDFEIPFLAVALPRVVDKVTPEYAEHRTLAARLDGGPAPEGDGELTVRPYVDGADEAALMARTAVAEGRRKILVLNAQDRYGEFAGTSAVNELSKAGVEHVDRLPLLKQWDALAAIESAVRKNAYDAVLVFGHGAEIPSVLYSLRKSGNRGAVLGNHAFGGKTVTMIEPALLAGVRFTAPAFYAGQDRPMTARFREEYRALNRDEPDIFSALGYDQVMMVFTAAKATDSTSPKPVRRHLLENKTYEGALGDYTFAEDGTARVNLTLIPLKDASVLNGHTRGPAAR